MKYILMMTGTKTGVDTYRAWSQKDIQTHFAHLTALKTDLTESGEFVTTEGLAMPHQAKVVHAGRNGTPITDGVFPEAKEFLLGYWIVDVGLVRSALMRLPPEHRRGRVPAACRRTCQSR